MNIREQKKQAIEFIKRWENRGNERQDSQSFGLTYFNLFMKWKIQASISLLKIK